MNVAIPSSPSPEPPMTYRPLGRLLVEMGAVTEAQLDQLLAIQRHDGRRLGEIVISRGLVSQLTLLTALRRQKQQAAPSRRRRSDRRPQSWKPLGEILVERRRVTPVQLRQALADQQVGGGFLGELLLDRGWVTALALVEALQEQLESTAAPGAAFVVRELDGDEWTVLFRATSFAEATDYVFDEVLLRRQPQRLAITHERGSREELVWNYIQEPTQRRNNEIGDILAALHAFAVEHALAS